MGASAGSILAFLKPGATTDRFEGGFCSFDPCNNPRYLGSVIVIIELHQQLALANLLAVVDCRRANQARNFCAQWC